MEFIAPPPEKKGERSERWRTIVKELKAHRGEWALVGNYSPGVASHLRRGKYRAFLEDSENLDPSLFMSQHWEITTRSVKGSDRNDVYIRWLG